MYRIPTLATLLVLSTILSGCGSGGSSARSITVYSGQHGQTTSKLAADFEAQTGIKVNLRSADEGNLVNQAIQEGNTSSADIFYAENSPSLEILRQKDLLAKVDSSTLAAVPAHYNSPQGNWVGVSARAATLVYNPKLVSSTALPSSVLDLDQTQWRGKLGLAPSEGDFYPVVSAVMHLEGSSVATGWLQGLQSNAANHIYSDSEALVAAVNRGEITIGVIDHYYWYRSRDELGTSQISSALHAFKAGDPGNLVDISGAAVLGSSSHQADAQKFLAFLVSKQGQNDIANSNSYEYAIGSGVETSKVKPSLSQLNPPAVTVADLGDGKPAVDLLKQVGLL